MGGVRFQDTQNDIQHGRCFLKYLIVPESEHPESQRFDSTVATLIIRTVFLMLSAIKLNYKFRVKTRKIRDIAADRHLPAESVAAELPTP
jgi:hypothetical protein